MLQIEEEEKGTKSQTGGQGNGNLNVFFVQNILALSIAKVKWNIPVFMWTGT